ncbi:pectate lyase [Streptomyces corynorhini]|uniref:Pectate lyase n=2 Tax=Streptomyces corynorhini TaxID=2282652 RepID=A0A370B5D1_9ACTN|nr:pectate lyase [Streptomyces corynorhini]RDG37020.1 pectate lyase [Streptomyces corynorhini]
MALTLTALAAPAQGQSRPAGPAAERAALPANDGWAAESGGTTGGRDATADHVYTVTTWAEFGAALGAAGNSPSVIRVKGTLDALSDGAGNALTCEDYEAKGYSFAQYLADYDPAVWGYDEEVSGEQEDLRAASAKLQGAQVKVNVPANTTIVGVGKDARVLGGSLQVKDVDNVIIRNLTFEDAFDCFPQWDPTDGAYGEWNSEYDNLVLYGSTHVWVDHNTFTDGRHPDSEQPSYFGRLYQQHDGLLDIVRGADLVTVSWNVIKDHDKTILIGNSDSLAAVDRGKLRVTLHHNQFKNVKERAPRVRFGKVDTYNNHYVVERAENYGYSFGIGIESRLVAEKNAFTVPRGMPLGPVLKLWKDSPVTVAGNQVNGKYVDLLAVHNAEIPEETLRPDAGWTPVLRASVDHPRAVPGLVDGGAGAGRLH